VRAAVRGGDGGAVGVGVAGVVGATAGAASAAVQCAAGICARVGGAGAASWPPRGVAAAAVAGI